MTPTPAEEWSLPTAVIGRRVWVFDELPSTNTFAAALPADTPDGTVIVARNQTAGRGQFGRTWQSRPGAALLMSVVLTPPHELRGPVILTAGAAVAVALAVRQLAGVQARIKWPNDVLVEGKKVSGILIEQAARTVVGIGLNLTQTADEFAALGLPGAASLGMVGGCAPGLESAAAAVVRSLDAGWGRLLAGDRAAVEADWREWLGLVGREVVVEQTDGGRRAGRLVGMGFDALELEVNGRVERIAPEAVEHVYGVAGGPAGGVA